MVELVQLLKEKQLKVTPQRLTIFRYLSQTSAHPTAETIYKQLETENPALSLATVYKTLCTLKNAGLIQEINVGEDSFRYDYTTEPHPHFICEKCREVYDLPPLKPMENLEDALGIATEHHIHHMQVYLYGTCSLCGEEKQNTADSI